MAALLKAGADILAFETIPAQVHINIHIKVDFLSESMLHTFKSVIVFFFCFI